MLRIPESDPFLFSVLIAVRIHIAVHTCHSTLWGRILDAGGTSILLPAVVSSSTRRRDASRRGKQRRMLREPVGAPRGPLALREQRARLSSPRPIPVLTT